MLLQNLLHSDAAPLPEYKTQAVKKSRFILSHYGIFKGCWDWLILGKKIDIFFHTRLLLNFFIFDT